MDTFARTLRTILTDMFLHTLKNEERALATMKPKLTVSEWHLMETVQHKFESGATMTRLAHALSVTPPSITAAVEKLSIKGYVIKERCTQDKRVVRVTLSDAGRAAVELHLTFHDRMINAIIAEMPDDERDCLTRGLNRLSNIFARVSREPHQY